MTKCTHNNLTLLPPEKIKMQCQHCHLTIKPEELGKSYCPECFEMSGRKRYDFEELAAEKTDVHRYRCEKCGVIIECE